MVIQVLRIDISPAVQYRALRLGGAGHPEHAPQINSRNCNSIVGQSLMTPTDVAIVGPN
jgi:hypothetical protein